LWGFTRLREPTTIEKKFFFSFSLSFGVVPRGNALRTMPLTAISLRMDTLFPVDCNMCV
jgi:hypothetical protein